MKRVFSFLIALLAAAFAFAQTPEEVLYNMVEAMEKREKDGLAMTVDVKLPIIGTMSTKTVTKGDKCRIDAKMMGVDVITWTDGNTSWTYNSKTNEIVIENDVPSSSTDSSGDVEMFEGITEGYDVSFEKETDQAWYILCKKSKDNMEKDDPKTMHVVVAKDTYYPVSLSAKMSGVSMTMRGISFGVSEDQVTFNPAKYPGATITDKR